MFNRGNLSDLAWNKSTFTVNIKYNKILMRIIQISQKFDLNAK